jgi:hypothetical protein
LQRGDVVMLVISAGRPHYVELAYLGSRREVESAEELTAAGWSRCAILEGPRRERV